MADESSHTHFVGSIAELYAALLVPIIFAQPARSVAAAIARLGPADVLETAAGTGVLTQQLIASTDAIVVATDLNAAMLDVARNQVPSERVHWQVADALKLPFQDGSFDVVACQFGTMFFPDKVAGYAEAVRVLRPTGTFVFTVWDRIEHNAVADVVTQALCAAAPSDSLDFLRRTPHGHFDVTRIERDLVAAGFRDVTINPMDGTSCTTARDGAIAYCQGTPLRNEIERSSLDLDAATAIATRALEATYGAGPFAAPTRWLQVIARGGHTPAVVAADQADAD